MRPTHRARWDSGLSLAFGFVDLHAFNSAGKGTMPLKPWTLPTDRQLNAAAQWESARVGLISDTHDLLREEALAELTECDWILHAGDICSVAVLDGLAALAPLSVVRGNNDWGEIVNELPHNVRIEIAGHRIYMVHDRNDIAMDPKETDVVVFGHSHKPENYEQDGVLFVNPGAAGKRRFTLPITLAILNLHGSDRVLETIELDL